MQTAASVDHFVANSTYVKARIAKYYGRDASVIHPPVDLERFGPLPGPRGDFYVTLSALVPYKRVDLAVAAFNQMGKRLVVIGGGNQEAGLRRAAGASVDIRGHVAATEVVELLGSCRALIMPGIEDFGIGVVEALASGAPVIALGEGGVRDTVRGMGDGVGEPTGMFFSDPTVPALCEAAERFEQVTFDPALVAASAQRFSRQQFLEGMRSEIDEVLSTWPSRRDGTRAVQRV